MKRKLRKALKAGRAKVKAAVKAAARAVTPSVPKTVNVEAVIRSIVLIKLSISHWGGMTRAKDLETEIAEKHDARADQFRTVAAYIDKCFLKRVNSARSQLYTTFHLLTIPWEDGGWRGVSVDAYQELMKRLESMVAMYRDTVREDLIGRYPEIRAAAEQSLGEVFDPAKFPTVEDLAAKYGAEIQSGAVASPDDIRYNLGGDVLESMKKSMREQYAGNIRGAMENVVGRLRDVVSDVVVKMGAPDPKGLHFATLKARLSDAVEALPKLNVTGDPIVGALIADVKSRLMDWNPKAVKVQDSARAKVAGAATDILAAIDNYKV